MRALLFFALLLTLARVAWADDCPAAVYLDNYTWRQASADGMKGNGGYITFNLASSVPTGAGQTCTYRRPSSPGYSTFIGRNRAPDEVSATPSGRDAWQVALRDGGSRTVTCPMYQEIGPVLSIGSSGGMRALPDGYVVLQNNVQRLSFESRNSNLPFEMRCEYRGWGDVVMYVPPVARPISTASCAGLYAAGPLSARLAACPGLADLILWEDGAGAVTSYSGHSYPAWTPSQRARLDDMFARMQRGEANLGLNCPNPADNLWAAGQRNSATGVPQRGELLTQMFFTRDQAFDTFAAQVAWSLHLEVSRALPWSLLNHPAVELAEIFDARRHHTRFPAISAVHNSGYTEAGSYPTAIQAGRDYWNSTSRISAAWEAVCDPRVAYQFLSGGPPSSSRTNLLGANQRETLKKLTWWFYNNVAHGDGRDSRTSDVLRNQAVYLSGRLTARSDTYFTPPSQPLVIASAGCHSASNLFRDLAIGVNIPLLHVASLQPGNPAEFPYPPVYMDYGRHSGLVYSWGNPASTLVLEHADAIYAQYGVINPVDSTGRPVADPAEFLFTHTWQRPAELSRWGYASSNDLRLQTPFSRYGNTGEREVGTQGVLYGYWPNSTPHGAGFNRALWYEEGQLCSHGGGHGVMSNYCANTSPDNLQRSWQGSFGQTVLQAPGGGVSLTAVDYLNRLKACARGTTGLSDNNAACASFTNPDNPYDQQQRNRRATTSWVGPGDI